MYSIPTPDLTTLLICSFVHGTTCSVSLTLAGSSTSRIEPVARHDHTYRHIRCRLRVGVFDLGTLRSGPSSPRQVLLPAYSRTCSAISDHGGWQAAWQWRIWIWHWHRPHRLSLHISFSSILFSPSANAATAPTLNHQPLWCPSRAPDHHKPSRAEPS